MKTKTFRIKESGFVAVFVNARTKSEARKKYMMKHGWYGGNLSIMENEKKLKLYPKKNKYPAKNLMELYQKRRKRK